MVITFSQVTEVESPEFQEAMRIYTESFPPFERHSLEVIASRTKSHLYHLFIGRMPNGLIATMALLYPLKKTEFILLDYLAIDSHFRGQGIGSYFINHLCHYAFKCLHQSYLLMEVENPWQGSRTLEQEKRWNFYHKLGAKELKKVRYLLPPLGGIGPTEMSLMVFSHSSQDTLEGSLVKNLIQQIYQELYNREKDDSMLNSLLDKIGEFVSLE